MYTGKTNEKRVGVADFANEPLRNATKRSVDRGITINAIRLIYIDGCNVAP